jgi:adenylate cyclase
MGDRSTQQRLAAVLAADVVGYTRLMEEDTEGTVAAWQAVRDGVINPTVEAHSGRLVKLTGDGFLAEFPTVHEAVKCGVEMQQSFAESSLDFRVGINLGDIIDDGQDTHGEGVNVAARIEALAEPGGILISGGVYEQVRNRIEATYEDMGEREVKNVSAPVKVYRLVLDSIVKPASAGLAMPDKPSIAVLPFANMSGDAEQEYFSDGMAEDIITGLSLFRGLFVIARNSTFVYKGSSVDIPQVARELGVRYVLEGSVRKAGNRVRITVQLIEAQSGSHIWAERYDRELDDIFALQDEITEQVVSATNPAVMTAETERARRRRPDNLVAHDWLLRGLWHFNTFKEADNAKAQALFKKSVEIDAEFGLAYAWLAMAQFMEAYLNWSTAPEKTLQDAHDAAKRAVALDSRNEFSHAALSSVSTLLGRNSAALVAARRGVELNPGNSYPHLALALALINKGGAYEEANAAYDATLRLNPVDPTRFFALSDRASAHYQLRRYEDAIEWAHKALQVRYGYIFARALVTASLAQLDRVEEASAELAEIIRLKPDFSTASFALYRWPDTARDHLFEGLYRAGLPQ